MRLSSQAVNQPLALSEALHCFQLVARQRTLREWFMQQAYRLLRTGLFYNALRTYQALKSSQLNEIDEIHEDCDNGLTSTNGASRLHPSI